MAAGKVGTVFVANESGAVGTHHRVPQCLLRLNDQVQAGKVDGTGIEAWLEWEAEAIRYGVDPDMSHGDLESLIEASCVVMERAEHRAAHSEASDFVRWGRRSGLQTLRRYGRGWFALLRRRRHGRITPEELRAGSNPAPAPLGAA